MTIPANTKPQGMLRVTSNPTTCNRSKKLMTSKLKTLVAYGVSAAVLMSSSSAYAAGTLVGTDIANNVSVGFQVGGVAQTAATASDTFKVDRKIIFTVTEATPTGTTTVVPGQTAAVTTFTVSNTTNDTLDFSLAATQLATAGTAKHGGTDAFDVSGLAYFVDADPDGAGPLLPDGIYTAGVDTATTVDNLAPDASVKVFIIGNIASTVTNGQVAGVTLTGTALNSNGTTITAATDLTANTSAVETIFADTGRNGIEADSDDYTVGSAVLSVAKLSRVVSDGVSASNPKAIPGAVVEYCIAVTNAASAAASATNVNIADDLSLVPNVTFLGSFTPKVDGTVVSGSTCTPGATNGAYTAPNVTGTLTNIAPGETRTLVFRVTIN
jgi:hypothetical protein